MFVISGNTAKEEYFHAYHLEGISRWNQDRARTWAGAETALRCYTPLLMEAVDEQAQKLVAKHLPELAMKGRVRDPEAVAHNIAVPKLREYTGKFCFTIF